MRKTAHNITRDVTCHATNGPPEIGPPGPSMAAIDGPPGPSMAAIGGPPLPQMVPPQTTLKIVTRGIFMQLVHIS